MARVLIIGAAGLLGREIARAVAARPDLEAVRTSRAARPGWLRFDAERDSAETLLVEPVDLVVNCAGVLASEIGPDDPAGVRRAVVVNGRFPHELALAARERGVRLVHVSTDAVFRDDAGRCFEDGDRFADDVYGATKRRGEPALDNALSLRCSFVGPDPQRRRGLLEWLLAQPPGTELDGYVDQAWNGLTSAQVASVCLTLVDAELFARARSEGPVHHLFEDPPLTKHGLLALCAHSFRPDAAVVPVESGRPVTRVLGTRHAVLRACLESTPPRAASLEAFASRGVEPDG